MKSLWSLVAFISLSTACATDPNSTFDLEALSAQESKDFQAAKVILLGEVHDNPSHHQIQNDVLQTLADEGRLTSVIFEQIDWTYQGILDQLTTNNFERLPKQLDWKESGWPDFDYYRPLLKTAHKAKAKIIAGGLPKNRLEMLSKAGYEVAFNAAELERLKLRTPLDGVGHELLTKEIYEGHCKMIPEDAVEKMIPLQRARDAAMVKGYLKEADTSGVTVFILGNGHARKEFGVPTLLRNIDPNLKIWSVGMQEVGNEALPDGAFDKVWITEKAEREDPCVAMQKHMEGKKSPDAEPATQEPATEPATEESAAEPTTDADDEEKPSESEAMPRDLPPVDPEEKEDDEVEPNPESPASDTTDTPAE